MHALSLQAINGTTYRKWRLELPVMATLYRLASQVRTSAAPRTPLGAFASRTAIIAAQPNPMEQPVRWRIEPRRSAPSPLLSQIARVFPPAAGV